MATVTHTPWRQGVLAPAPVYLDASVLVGYWVEWLKTQGSAYQALADRLGPRSATLVTEHVAARRLMQVSHPCLDESLFKMAEKLTVLPALLGMPRQPPQGLMAFLNFNTQAMRAIRPALVDCVNDARTWAELTGVVHQDIQSVVDSVLDRLADVDGVTDAFHLAVAEHCGARSLVTGDRHFASLTTLPKPLTVVKV